MELKWPDGSSNDPTEEQIRALVPTAEYVVLAKTRLTYIQCCQRTLPPWGITLEYQEGSMKRHYRGALGPYDAETVISAMIKYLNDDSSWHSDICHWDHLDMKRLLRLEARWRREAECRKRLTARWARAASQRMPPWGRRRRPAPLRSTVGPERVLIPDAESTMPGAHRYHNGLSRSGVRGTVRRAIAAVRRWLSRQGWRRRPGP